MPENANVPSGFHVVGHVALLHVDSTLREYHSKIGEATLKYDKRIKTVAIQTGPTEGETRKPSYRIVAGNHDTTTIHVENGISYKFNPITITFSGGNKKERINIYKRIAAGEKVVDMFSCVGQFALPIAKWGYASVTAIELNPEAYGYLVENIRLNRLEDRVTAILGDCRVVHPSHSANRVVMGYLHHTETYLPYALDTLVEEGGTIHMHLALPNKSLSAIISSISEICLQRGFVSLTNTRKIKNYSPGIEHVVFDISVKPV
ncbi:MAG: class I SAM-dependent methyltransferase family protein [Candidatus Thorarchaeota archaeon]|nr:class I SAM-dependent methyltransferase family protein [Candidatus Thorarchaeota archaeon]